MTARREDNGCRTRPCAGPCGRRRPDRDFGRFGGDWVRWCDECLRTDARHGPRERRDEAQRRYETGAPIADIAAALTDRGRIKDTTVIALAAEWGWDMVERKKAMRAIREGRARTLEKVARRGRPRFQRRDKANPMPRKRAQLPVRCWRCRTRYTITYGLPEGEIERCPGPLLDPATADGPRAGCGASVHDRDEEQAA